ncbi:outer membrane protein assembly factor [Halosquirtibacter laminarini]|uniref:Outer membrane protein assembly factor n=1 Tax=Halosquirtibacter laminarini TaxID=3374600 RepID=A0AC61NC99_9BACT|nr:outer membrane protein assembly factor [Prolixibacteraceae bacterium]
MKIVFFKSTLFLFFLLFFSHQMVADEKSKDDHTKKIFKDSLDGAFDVSDFLATKTGFLAVPGIVTNPAVGYGGYATALFFHSSFAESQGFPTMTGVIGGGTENSSWMLGAYHLQSFFEDRFRLTSFFGYGDVNLRFFGRGYTDFLKNHEVMLGMDAWVLFVDGSYRINNTNFFVGGRYVFVNNDSRLSPNVSFLDLDFKSTVSEIGLVVSYDSRNNFFSPSKGIKGEVNYQYSGTWLGADNNYSRLYSYLFGYIPITKKQSLGIRGEYDVAFSGAPFYMEPFVNLRGVAIMRYQDKQMFEAEAEYQFSLYKRWSGVTFVGVGDAWGTGSSFFEDDVAVSGGFGFRYLLARKFGMKTGIDFAWSKDTFAFSIVIGSAWLRN